LKNQDLQDFLYNLPPGQACLILKGGRTEDLARVRSTIEGRCLSVLGERTFEEPDGLVTLAVSLPPRSLHDLILELAAKGVDGELIGYEAGEERDSWFEDNPK